MDARQIEPPDPDADLRWETSDCGGLPELVASHNVALDEKGRRERERVLTRIWWEVGTIKQLCPGDVREIIRQIREENR